MPPEGVCHLGFMRPDMSYRLRRPVAHSVSALIYISVLSPQHDTDNHGQHSTLTYDEATRFEPSVEIEDGGNNTLVQK